LYYLGGTNATKNSLTNLCNLLVCACEAFRYGLTFLQTILCSGAVLAAKLLAVESQLAAFKQRIDSKKCRRPRFTASFRLLWILLSKSLEKWKRPCFPEAASYSQEMAYYSFPIFLAMEVA